jgi:GDP-L-fucose synthase
VRYETPRRAFLHVDDLADADPSSLRRYECESHLNVGTGCDISVRELADLIAEIVGWRGELTFHTTCPTEYAAKALERLTARALGWTHGTSRGARANLRFVCGFST